MNAQTNRQHPNYYSGLRAENIFWAELVRQHGKAARDRRYMAKFDDARTAKARADFIAATALMSAKATGAA